ncbi:PERC peroxidase, partial [Acromyrmex charruanus]
APKYQQHNVRGLYELQRRELYEWYFAVRHDCRWQYRKFVVYVWGDLYNHKESSDSRKSVIWHRQSNSELASAGESGQTLTSLIVSSLSCALSKSREANDKTENYAKSQMSNHEIRISGEHEQSFFTSMNALGKRVNISLDYKHPLISEIQENNANAPYPGETAHLKYVPKLLRRETQEVAADVLQPRNSYKIMYIPTKETNQTGDGIRHKFLNASHISEISEVTEITTSEIEDKKIRKMEDRLKEKFLIGSLNNTGIKISESLNNSKHNNSQQVKFFQKRNDDVQTNKYSNISGILMMKIHSKKSDNTSIRLINMETQNVEAKADNQTLDSHTEQKWESEEDALLEAAKYGLQAMHDLYYVQEPKLYSMGLYLESNNPARYVAAFNDQSEEARDLARFGYAALQGTSMFLKKFPNTPLELPLIRNKLTKRTSLEQQCPQRDPPQCPRASLRYRTSDGSCNNLQNLWWGSAMSTMQRFLPPDYHDGVQSIRRSKNGRPLPSARDITSLIHENKDVPLASVTHMLMQWGQFVDHDLTATGQSRGFNGTVPQCCLQGGIGFQPPEFMHPECLPIAVNLRDNFYGPLGVRCLEFLRSGPAPKEGCEFGPREQLSQVTSYLDASMVYSSNAMHSDSLRIFRNGLLQYGRIQSRRSSFLKPKSDLCKRGSLSTTCFRAGDGRLSEQPALISLHVVFLRLHNRIATELSALNSQWSDEKLFQEARRIVGAVIQHITYREFLPIILGPQVMKIFDLEVHKKGYYKGYDPTVNPTIANSFSTAAYRFGHSLVQRSFIRFDSNHRPIFNNVSIHDEFTNHANLDTAGSVDRLLLGLVNQPCQRRDEFITEELTNHLFQTPGFPFGMDLASLNIQRGRDHGLPPYVRWRKSCSLSPIRTFEDLNKVMSLDVIRKLKSLYSSVEDIDLFSAGLAEKSVVGGLVGPTFACIIAQQFSNLRRGDRFWYENPNSESSFTADQLQQIRQVTLAQVLCQTMDGIETIQPFVFLATDILKNQRLSCNDLAIGHLSLEFWIEQPSEFKSNVDNSQKVKRAATDTSFSISKLKEGNIHPRRKVHPESNPNKHTKVTTLKPFQNSVNQENKIIVKRPLVRPNNNNVTIVIQNNAINAPVFVNEGIYGSHIKIQEQLPISSTFRPQGKPIPTTIPHSSNFYLARQPYVPYTFNDPHNPNPLAYGYRLPLFTQDDAFYDNYSATSPRPTLYTYYTNFQQTTTQIPEIDDYLINYGLLYHNLIPAYSYKKPKLLENFGHHKLKDQNPAQKPNYADPELLTNMEFLTNYNVKIPDNSRPNEDLHHVQNLIYNGFSSLTNFRSDKPNQDQESYGKQKLNGIRNLYLQNNDLINGLNEGHSINLNKPQYQEQWNSNDQKKPSKTLYNYDDLNLYQKKPDVESPSYSIDNSETNILSYQKDTFTDSNILFSINNNYNWYSGTTQIDKKILSSTQSGWTDVLSHIKQGNTQSPFSKDIYPYSSFLFNQTPTSYPTYQKDDQSKASLKVSGNKSFVDIDLHEHNNNSHKNLSKSYSLNKQLLSSTSEISIIGIQVHKQEKNLNPKRTKVQNVTIVSETIEAVHHPDHIGYVSQPKATSEISRPLVQQIKSNVPVIKKAGQYYYEKNILRQYPDEIVSQSPKSNPHLTDKSDGTLIQDRKMISEKIAVETSVIDNPITNSEVIQNENKLIPTLLIITHSNHTGDVKDVQSVSSIDIESVAPADDINLPFMKMIAVLSNISVSFKELPKSIKSRSHDTS